MAACVDGGVAWQDLRAAAAPHSPPAGLAQFQRLGGSGAKAEGGSSGAFALDRRAGGEGLEAARPRRLLCSAFSQDGSQFVVGTTGGLAVYDTSPAESRWALHELPEAVGSRVVVAAALFRTGVVAVVALDAEGRGGDRVRLWDAGHGTVLGELRAGPRDAVRCVVLRRDLFVMVCERFVRVYDAETLLPKLHLPTAANPDGLCAATATGHPAVLCCPGEATGEVRILQGLSDGGRTSVQAHDKALRQLSLSQDGALVVTASEYGTIVKVFCRSGRLLRSVRLASLPQSVAALAVSAGLGLAGVAFASDPCVYVFHIGGGGGSPDTAAESPAAGEGDAAVRPTKAGLLSTYCACLRIPDVDAKGQPQVDTRDEAARIVGPQLAFLGESLYVLHFDGVLREACLGPLLSARPGAACQELRVSSSTMYLAVRPGWAFSKDGMELGMERRQDETDGSDWELLS